MPDATPRRRRRASSFGTARRLPSGRYQVRYYDKAGVRHTADQTFPTKADADAWLASVRTDIDRGGWVDPRKGRETLEDWAEDWMATRVALSPKTLQGYDSLLRNHVLPYFGRMKIADVQKSTVKRFVAQMTRNGAKPGTVTNAYRVLSGVLKHAVEDEALVRNPADGIDLPRSGHTEMVFLSAAQVEDLAEAITHRPHRPDAPQPDYGFLVRFAAWTGLRAAEIVGLRAGRVNTLLGTVRVVETTVALHGGVLLERQPTKNRGERTVHLPRFLAAQLADHLGTRAGNPDALVFPGPDGGPLRETWWYQAHYKPAVHRAGLPSTTRFHDLRHTAASLMILQGAPPRQVMEQLGHSTITVTMDRYGHIFPSERLALAARLDEHYRDTVASAQPVAEVTRLHG
jgi:integrase